MSNVKERVMEKVVKAKAMIEQGMSKSQALRSVGLNWKTYTDYLNASNGATTAQNLPHGSE